MSRVQGMNRHGEGNPSERVTGHLEDEIYRLHRRKPFPPKSPDHRRPLPHSSERDPDDPEATPYDVEMRRRLLQEIAATAQPVLQKLWREAGRLRNHHAREIALTSYLLSLGLETSTIVGDLRNTVEWWRQTMRGRPHRYLRPLYPTIYPEAGPETDIRLRGKVNIRHLARLAKAHNEAFKRHAPPSGGERISKRHTLAVHWLVQHHFFGDTYAVIARQYGITPKAVETGVKQMADYFRIRLGPAAKGGRPRGSRTQTRLHPA